MRRLKIKDSKVAKEAIRRLVKEHKEVFDSLARGRSEEDLTTYERLICSEACPHCDPLNSFCWRSWNYISPYGLCREGIQIDEDGNLVYPVGEEE